MPLSPALALVLTASVAASPTIDIDLGGRSPEQMPVYRAGGSGVERRDESGEFLYSVALPEGLYRVTLTLGDRRSAGRTTVKTESRRLVLRDVATRRGQTITRSFLVDVRNARLPAQPAGAPRFGQTVLLDERDLASFSWDDKLTFEFLGQPRVSAIHIEPAKAPRLFLAGDSTVADQYTEPFTSWGQMLPAMLDDRVAVANHAKSGATLKSLIAQLRFSKLLTQMQEGDWLFIQFGHNDQKAEWPMTYLDPELTYPSYLRSYIAEARRRGVHPVLVTSPERRNFDDAGRIKDTLGAYAAAVRKVAAEENVPLIDLNRDSIAIMQALGPDISPRAFAENGKDRTHNNNYGAWLFAAAIARQVREKIPELAPYVVPGNFDPAHPPLPEALPIAPSISLEESKPEGS
ncbi:MAG: rhamnogalacturonan acetylesterase [Novosphingobium sp.]|uniref:rhamnogalacturonan acetylesterase n=1 Tax=Novosphingobium sp. TaxID=1874826 RepID=UPI0012CD64EF|nr:rhamnogalacturonan acetylesterase [Novosphingobium sp.]MPS70206.1 rhamnogalacturonan acetylesterase [Novosphingobium sp.]